MAERALLDVRAKTGTLYVSSKEDKGEGWTKQEFKNPQNKEEILVRYHRSLSIEGKLNYLVIGDDIFKGKVLKMILGGETESYALTVPIMNTGGSFTTTNQYFNSLIGSLENVKKGDKITAFVNKDKKDKNDRLYKNIVLLDEEGKLIKSNFNLSEVPKWNSETTEDAFGEKIVKWDASPANKFYIDKAKQVTEAFKTESPKEEERQPEKPKLEKKTSSTEHDDLPF